MYSTATYTHTRAYANVGNLPHFQSLKSGNNYKQILVPILAYTMLLKRKQISEEA